MSEQQTPEQLASKLAADQERVRNAYLKQRELLDDNMIVSGKTVKEWRDELWVEVPVDALSPQVCMDVNAAIWRSQNIAAYEHNKAQMRAQILQRQAGSAYYQVIDRIVAESKREDKRAPSAATLETMAEVETDIYKGIAIHGDNELRFWKSILDHLQFCKKIMEQEGYQVGAEIRMGQQGNYLEKLGNNYGGNK